MLSHTKTFLLIPIKVMLRAYKNTTNAKLPSLLIYYYLVAAATANYYHYYFERPRGVTGRSRSPLITSWPTHPVLTCHRRPAPSCGTWWRRPCRPSWPPPGATWRGWTRTWAGGTGVRDVIQQTVNRLRTLNNWILSGLKSVVVLH